jgi:hypothetical protein
MQLGRRHRPRVTLGVSKILMTRVEHRGNVRSAKEK